MGEVVKIVSQEAAERAWEEYSILARRIVDEPSLLLDRKHREETWRAERRFRDLFLQLDRHA